MDIPAKIAGFAPDYDISTPGVITGGGPFWPTLNGVGGVNSPVSAGFPALASACKGAATIRKIDDSRRTFAGTQTRLYEASGTSWNDVSSATYTGGTDNRWRFAQFGNDTIATNRADPVQVSSSGSFANLGGGPPRASIVDVCQGFVMLFDYNDGSNDYPDGWWCSALRNDASWGPSIATQAANGRLLDTPGTIRAGRALGNVMMAYKERSMYVGGYQGPPVIWDWQLVSGDVGCVGQEAIQLVIIDDVPCHIFAGFDGFYLHDGTRPRFIGNPLKKWFNDNVSATYRYRIQSLADPLRQLVIFYLADAAGNINFAVAYNYRADRWGNMPSITPVEAVLQYINPGITYDSLGTYYATYDNLPDISYDSPFWTSNSTIPGVFNSDHTLYSYNGTPGTGNLICGYTGDAGRFSTLTRIRPRFNLYPSGAVQGRVYYTQNLGDTAPSVTSYQAMSNGKIDILKSSKWCAPEFSLTGSYELTGYTLTVEPDGEE